MPNPLASDAVQPALTNFSVALFQEESAHFADKVFPLVPVGMQAGLYYQFDTGDLLRDEMQPLADGAPSAGGGYGLSTGNYACVVEAFHHDVGPQLAANFKSQVDMDQAGARFVTQKARIRMDRRWVTSFFGTGIWNNERAGVAVGPVGTEFLRWDDPASTPVSDVTEMSNTVRAATGFKPNVLVCSPGALNALKNHDDVRDFYKYTSAGPTTEEVLARIFGVERIVEAASVFNSALGGVADNVGYIAGNHALLCYAAPNPAPMTPSAGYNFVWRELAGNDTGIAIVKEKTPNTFGTMRYDILTAWDARLVSAALGGFFLNAVS